MGHVHHCMPISREPGQARLAEGAYGVHTRSHTSAELGMSGELFGMENRSYPKNDLVGRSALGSRHLSTVFFLYVLYKHRLETSWLRGLHPLLLAGALVTDPCVTLSSYLSESQFPHQ